MEVCSHAVCSLCTSASYVRSLLLRILPSLVLDVPLETSPLANMAVSWRHLWSFHEQLGVDQAAMVPAVLALLEGLPDAAWLQIVISSGTP